jgi:hypothetical protein
VPSDYAACPRCAAQPGEGCRNLDGSPFMVDGVVAVHAERIEANAFVEAVENSLLGGDAGAVPTKEEFAAAVNAADVV